MKKILVLFCIVMAIYAIWFPLSYFKSNNDKKEIRVSHILVDTKEEAEKIKQEINDGKDFESMVKEHSVCPTKDNKGDIGFVQRGRYNSEFENAVFNLKNNEISQPVNSENGWHIIKITKIKYYSDSENFKYNKYKYLEL